MRTLALLTLLVCPSAFGSQMIAISELSEVGARITWDPVPGASRYTIWWAANPGYFSIGEIVTVTEPTAYIEHLGLYFTQLWITVDDAHWMNDVYAKTFIAPPAAPTWTVEPEGECTAQRVCEFLFSVVGFPKPEISLLVAPHGMTIDGDRLILKNGVAGETHHVATVASNEFGQAVTSLSFTVAASAKPPEPGNCPVVPSGASAWTP